MVTAALAREAGFAINALTIDYSQRHRCEIEAARIISRDLGTQRHVVLGKKLYNIIRDLGLLVVAHPSHNRTVGKFEEVG